MMTTDAVTEKMSVIERALLDVQRLQRRSTGSVLFYEGDAARSVYIIHSGEVDLVYAAKNGVARPLQAAGPGQILGIDAVVGRRPHDATALVRAASEIGYVAAEDLLALLDTNPAVWFTVLQSLSENVNSCWTSMRELTTPR